MRPFSKYAFLFFTWIILCDLLTAQESKTDSLRATGDRELLKNTYQSLAQKDSLSGDFVSALKNYKSYLLYRDSLLNKANEEKIARSEMKFDFAKKELLLKEEHERATALALEQSKRRKLSIIFIACIAMAILIIAIVVFRSLRLTKQQKLIIEKQKELVEEKQKEVLDSIRYAKRIQNSLLPTEKYISKKIGHYQNKRVDTNG